MIRPASLLVLLTAALWVGHSCQKSNHSGNNNNNGGLATQPTAQAGFDNQSGGVYKGTLTGSSGYFEVNLQETKPFIIYQWMTPQGNIDSLFTTSLGSWSSGQAITKAVFTATDGSLFWFSVNGDGSSPSIDSVYITGHTGPVYASIAKELSTSLLKVYQGAATVTGGGTGCFDGITTMWTIGSVGAFSYLGTDGTFGAGTVSISGNQAQVVLGANAGNGTNNETTGTLTISADGSTLSGTVTGKTCVHAVSLTRIL